MSRGGHNAVSHSLSIHSSVGPQHAALLAAAKATQAAAKATEAAAPTKLQLVCLSAADAFAPAKHRINYPAAAMADVNGVRLHCRRVGSGRALGERSVDEPVELTPYVAGRHQSAAPLTVRFAAETTPQAGLFIVGVRFARYVGRDVRPLLRPLLRCRLT